MNVGQNGNTRGRNGEGIASCVVEKGLHLPRMNIKHVRAGAACGIGLRWRAVTFTSVCAEAYTGTHVCIHARMHARCMHTCACAHAYDSRFIHDESHAAVQPCAHVVRVQHQKPGTAAGIFPPEPGEKEKGRISLRVCRQEYIKYQIRKSSSRTYALP